MRTFVDAFEGYDAVVTPSGSCAGSARHQHGIVARSGRVTPRWRGVERTAPRTYELSEFLVDVLGRDRRRRVLPAPRDLPPDLPLAADARRRRPPARLLRAVRGLDLVELPGAEECCGFGGTFAVKNADTSVAMGSDKARHVRETGAEVLVAGDNSLPHAHRRAAVPAALRHPRDAPRRGARRDRGSAMTARSSGCRRSRTPPAPRSRTRSCGATSRTPRRRSAPSGPGGRRGRRLGGAAARRRGDQGRRAARWTPHLLQLEERSPQPGRRCTGPATPTEACAIVAEVARPTASTRSSRSSRWPPRRSASTRPSRREGIAAWETDLAELIVQLGDDLPSHILVPAIHRNRAEIREIFQRRMAGAGGPHRRARRCWPARRGCTCARSSCARMAVSGANFAVAETGTLVVVESEGNGRMCLTLPEVLVSVVGIEKVVPDLGGPRRLPAAAAAVVDRRADEPLHLDLVRRHARRRPAGSARRPARQRPHPGAGRPGRPPGAALHPLLGLPQLCPVYERTGGHAYGSVYPGPIGAILNPLLQGVGHRRADRLAAVRVQPVRRLLRGLPGAHRHPVGAGRPARPGRRRAPRRACPGARRSR